MQSKGKAGGVAGISLGARKEPCDLGYARLACRFSTRLRGLLGSAPSAGQMLVLAPCNDVHTYGMAYCLDIAFVSEAGQVLRAMRAVPPMKRIRCKGASYVVERESNPDCAWFREGERVALRIEQEGDGSS